MIAIRKVLWSISFSNDLIPKPGIVSAISAILLISVESNNCPYGNDVISSLGSVLDHFTLIVERILYLARPVVISLANSLSSTIISQPVGLSGPLIISSISSSVASGFLTNLIAPSINSSGL